MLLIIYNRFYVVLELPFSFYHKICNEFDDFDDFIFFSVHARDYIMKWLGGRKREIERYHKKWAPPASRHRCAAVRRGWLAIIWLFCGINQTKAKHISAANIMGGNTKKKKEKTQRTQNSETTLASQVESVAQPTGLHNACKSGYRAPKRMWKGQFTQWICILIARPKPNKCAE